MRHIFAAGALAAVLVSSSAAQGRSGRDFQYQADVIWPMALRMLRVELGYTLVERDQEAQYLLFQYVEGRDTRRGSLELVERRDGEGRQVVRVFVALPSLPTYVELHVLDRLERKLRREIGPPIPAPSTAQKQPPTPDPQSEPDGGG